MAAQDSRPQAQAPSEMQLLDFLYSEWGVLSAHSLYKDPKSLISWGCSESWVEMYFQTMT